VTHDAGVRGGNLQVIIRRPWNRPTFRSCRPGTGRPRTRQGPAQVVMARKPGS